MRKEQKDPDQDQIDALCPECGHAFKVYVDRIMAEGKTGEMNQKIDCPVCGCGTCNIVRP